MMLPWHGRGSGFKSRRVHTTPLSLEKKGLDQPQRNSDFMTSLKHIRETDFELIVELSQAVYKCRGGEVKIGYGDDGKAYCTGSKNAVRELYALLKSRPELRIENSPPYQLCETFSDSIRQEEGEQAAEVATIMDWLAIHTMDKKTAN